MRLWILAAVAVVMVGCFDEAAVQVEADTLADSMATRAEVSESGL
jgi:hypothetical protein